MLVKRFKRQPDKHYWSNVVVIKNDDVALYKEICIYFTLFKGISKFYFLLLFLTFFEPFWHSFKTKISSH
ncbi:Hypothetical protein SRAE_1000245700 [Strongyloides ratti]|uniref:Uncharacterized protein n=1 Tax=Strongyloides ratti TaxID=34506 RepID=A0A090L3E6_STRRB|nr:Hypothetical protein SRAE_1000245700 [Strongyloides ratti]CEF64202.1 Hypothetical protein SRAE_1000245700 [Strongyloides ratti]